MKQNVVCYAVLAIASSAYVMHCYFVYIPYSLYKFVTLCAPKNSSFEAIRTRMKKTIGGDEHLEFSDETLE